MKIKKETLKIVYAVLSILAIVLIPLIYSDIYSGLIYKTFDDAFVSADVIAVSPSYVSGKIQKIYVRSGDTVKKGQLIVLIDDTMYRANLEKTKAKLDAFVFRLSQLKDQFGSDNYRYTDVEREVGILKQDVRAAKLMLSYTRMVSPINGVVAKDVLHPGDSVSQSSVIMYLYEPHSLYVKAYIKVKYIKYFRVGMKILIKTGQNTLDGKVMKIGGVDVFNICNKHNPLVPVRIEVPQKLKKFLKFGTPVRLTIK